MKLNGKITITAIMFICLFFKIITAVSANDHKAQHGPKLNPQTSGCDKINFTTKNFTTASSPLTTVSVDLNKDGIPDLATAVPSSRSIEIRLGDGKGGFSPTKVVSTVFGNSQATIEALTAGDFDGDGKMDLIAFLTDAEQGIDQLVLLPGNGDGNFDPMNAKQFVSPANISAISTGDFNGDGSLDVVAVDSDLNIMVTFLNDGTGFFLTPSFHETGGISPTSLVVGDFNNDGKADVAMLNSGSASTQTPGLISLALNRGDGSFDIDSTLTKLSGTADSIVAADFNNDGNLDLAVSGSDTDSVTVLMGDGTGKFTINKPIAVGKEPGSLASGDFNEDGLADLVVVNRGSSNITALQGDGKGGFSNMENFAVGNSPSNVIAVDLNKDGSSDLVITNQSSNSISVLINSCSSSAVTDFAFNVTPQSQSVNAGDATNFNIAIETSGNLTEPIEMSAVSSDSSILLTFSKNSLMSNDNSMLTATTSSSTAAGNINITITGKSGNITHTTTASLNVSAPSAKFNLVVNPTTQNVDQGSSTSFTINVQANDNPTLAVNLSANSPDSSITANLSTNSVTPANSATLTVSTLSTTPANSYTIAIVASAGQTVVTQNVTVTVNAQAAPVITSVSYGKHLLNIIGTGFGSTGVTVTINGTDVSAFISTSAKNQVVLQGNKKKLKLKKGENDIVVRSANQDSNTFILNL